MRTSLLALLALFIIPTGLWAAAPQWTFSPASLAQGKAGLVKICLPPETAPDSHEAVFIDGFGRKFPLRFIAPNCWTGLIAADLEQKPAVYDLKLMAAGQELSQTSFTVTKADYGLRDIKVDPKYVEPPAEVRQRIQKESAQQREIYARITQDLFWQAPWQKPLNSKIVGPFGRASLINGQPRSPHGGVDLRGAIGTPVKAPATGKVVLALDSYFSGLMVLLDHGAGIYSGYRHLSEIMVNEGDEVTTGQIIGKVGASGRVTGPHLHFDVRISGARVDPTDLPPQPWLE